MGLLDNDLSPVKTDLNFEKIKVPVSNLALVPEFPR